MCVAWSAIVASHEVGGALDIEGMLTELGTKRTVYINSTSTLAQLVADLAKDIDKKSTEGGEEPPRRKKLAELPQRESVLSMEMTPWEVLHQLGRATVLTGQGASRGIAEHWGCLKYCEALGGHENGKGAMALSAEGRKPVHHHLTVQGEELGIGFALVAALRILACRLPGHAFTVIDADIALSAGWTIRGREVKNRDAVKLRPDYFIEARPPRGPSKVIILECKGNHSRPDYVRRQLVKASAQVEAVRFAGRGDLPSLAIGAQLKATAGITLHVLDPEGDGVLDLASEDPEAALNTEVRDLALDPFFEVPVELESGGRQARTVSGFQVPAKHHAWFARVLARTAAAELMAFCGERRSAASYLTKRQGAERFAERVAAWAGSVRDAEHRIQGVPFVGTDLVFRQNGVRLEAFSGMSAPLFERLSGGDVASYRRQSLDVFADWSGRREEGFGDWGGPVSVDADGSIMALRILPQGG